MSFVRRVAFVLRATIHDRHTHPPLLKCYGNHTHYFKSFSSIFHFPLFSGWKNRHVSSKNRICEPEKAKYSQSNGGDYAYAETQWPEFPWDGTPSCCRRLHIKHPWSWIPLFTNQTKTELNPSLTACLRLRATPEIQTSSLHEECALDHSSQTCGCRVDTLASHNDRNYGIKALANVSYLEKAFMSV